MSIPDAATEAAAEVLATFGIHRDDAHAALTAAMPAIEKHFRDAIVGEIERTVSHNTIRDFRFGVEHAIRIVKRTQ